MSASDSAKSRMERVLRLHEQVDALKLDIRQVYAEEKADGGDKTAMGAAISLIRKREKDRTAFEDREALTDVYLAAFEVGTAVATHTHAHEARSYAEEKGRGEGDASHGKIPVLSTTPDASVSKASSAENADLGTASFDPETGEITDNQDQIGGNGTDLPVEASTDKQAAGSSRPTNSNSQASPRPADTATGAASSSPAPVATKSDNIDLTIPDFLKRTDGYPKREAVEAV